MEGCFLRGEWSLEFCYLVVIWVILVFGEKELVLFVLFFKFCLLVVYWKGILVFVGVGLDLLILGFYF